MHCAETTRAKLIAEGIEAGDMKNLAHMLHPFGMDPRQIWILRTTGLAVGRS